MDNKPIPQQCELIFFLYTSRTDLINKLNSCTISKISPSHLYSSKKRGLFIWSQQTGNPYFLHSADVVQIVKLVIGKYDWRTLGLPIMEGCLLVSSKEERKSKNNKSKSVKMEMEENPSKSKLDYVEILRLYGEDAIKLLEYLAANLTTLNQICKEDEIQYNNAMVGVVKSLIQYGQFLNERGIRHKTEKENQDVENYYNEWLKRNSK